MSAKCNPIFLSHKSDNIELVERIADYLEPRGLPCWYAPRDIMLGENYNVRIAEDLERVDYVIVLITEDVGESSMVPKEVNLALAYQKPIIPLFIDTAELPVSLRLFLINEQGIPLDTSSFEAGMAELESKIEELIAGKDTRAWQMGTIGAHHKPVVFKQTTQSLLYHIQPQLLHNQLETLVLPDNYHLMKELLNENVLYLYDSANSNKFAIALSLLKEKGVTDIYEWSNDASFRQILDLNVKPNAGFILNIEMNDVLDQVRDHEFQLYLQQLQEKDSYLIILGKEEPQQNVLGEYSVLLPLPADVPAYLIKLMQKKALDEQVREEAVSWLTSKEALAVLPSRLLPKEAPDLITKLLQYKKGVITQKQFESSLSNNIEKRVQHWFKQNTSYYDEAFYLTIALFQGESYSGITARAEQLYDLFNAELHTADLEEGSRKPGRDEYLTRFHASVKEGTVRSDLGLIEEMQVFFDEHADGYYVWEYVWTQFPSYQHAIKKWLIQLIKERKPSTQNRIVALLIHLLKKDFPVIRKAIIQPLGQSNSPYERMIAVKVLQELARDRAWHDKVFALAKTWASQSNNDRLQWSAVVLLGTEAGVLHYPEALKIVLKAYDANYKTLQDTVKQTLKSFAELALYDKAYETVLFRQLDAWLKMHYSNERTFPFVLRFLQSMFQSYPALFTNCEKGWLTNFWKPYVYFSLEQNIPRKTFHHLFNAIVSDSKGNEDAYVRITHFFKMICSSPSESRVIKETVNHLITSSLGVLNDEELFDRLEKEIIMS